LEENIDEALRRIEQCWVERSNVLDLHGCYLKALPKEIKRLPWLQELDCSSNNLTSFDELADLNQLTKLDCSGNYLILLDGIGKLTQLTELRCSSNKLISLGEITDLKNLELLDLSHNKLTSLTAIEKLTTVRTLGLTRNQLGCLEELAGLTKLSVLHCELNRITSLEPIAELKHLKILYCGGNLLESLAFIAKLERLDKLYCQSNPFRSIKAIAGLKRLTKLNCSSIKLTSLDDIAKLKHLTELVIDHNQIRSLAGIAGLTQLTRLICSRCELTSLSAIVNLRRLTELECGGNHLTSLNELKHLPQLQKVSCKENPIVGVPHEFLDNISLLRAYWADLETSGALLNDRVKILLAGNGRVGKTTLADALKTRAPVLGSFESTVGILIDNLKYRAADRDWQLQVWDFGGQELYHATHRLFLSQEGIYLVLWAEETDEGDDEAQHNLRYYLDMISEFAPGSPIIVVKNQIDRSNQKGRVHPTLADGKYKHLPHCLISAKHYSNFAELDAHIQAALQQIGALKTEIPKSWGKVRASLEGIDAKCLSYKDFTSLSAQDHVIHPDVLLGYLHNNGDCFHVKGQFGGTIFLDQNWLLDAVYGFFKTGNLLSPRRVIEGNRGIMTGAESIAFLNPVAEYPRYSLDEVETLLHYMTDSSLAFEKGMNYRFSNKIFVLPSLMPKACPLVGFPEPNTTMVYRLHFPWLHRLVIEKLIVELQRFSNAANWWRNGIRVAVAQGDHNAIATVVADAKASTLTLYFMGEGYKLLWLQIVALIEQCRLAKPDQEAMRFGEDDWVEKDHIFQVHELSKVVKDRSGNKVEGLLYYQLLDLTPDFKLSDAEPAPLLDSQKEKPVNKEYYVSYAWNDDRSPQGLERETKVNQLRVDARAREIHIIQDKFDMKFGDSITRFMDRIGTADRIFILLSDKYLKSEFCMYELNAIWIHARQDEDEFTDKVRIITLDDADIWNIEGRAEYVAYWRDKVKSFEGIIAKLGLDCPKKDFNRCRAMKQFADSVGDTLSTIADRVQPKAWDDFLQYGFGF